MATIKTIQTLHMSNVDEAFIQYVSSFYQLLVNNSTPITITSQEADKYRGDLFSLLLNKSVPQDTFIHFMVANKISSPMEYDGNTILLLPNRDIVTSINNTYITREI